MDFFCLVVLQQSDSISDSLMIFCSPVMVPCVASVASNSFMSFLCTQQRLNALIIRTYKSPCALFPSINSCDQSFSCFSNSPLRCFSAFLILSVLLPTLSLVSQFFSSLCMDLMSLVSPSRQLVVGPTELISRMVVSTLLLSLSSTTSSSVSTVSIKGSY